jgi:acetyl esterase/lipase
MKKTIAALTIICLGWAVSVQAGTAFHDPIYGVSKTSNIQYGTAPINYGADMKNLYLDLYRPVDIGGGALPAISPGVVLIHWGSFTGGNKKDMTTLANIYTKYGYTVASIDYRLLGDNVPANSGPADAMTMPDPPYATVPVPQGIYTINAAVEDATTAMAWMRSSAETYNIDANHIAIGGVSAGAITALFQAYNNPPMNGAPQAVVSFAGAMYGTYETIQAGAAPAFVVHSNNDTVVPFDAPLGAAAMVDQMNRVGVYNEFYIQSVGHAVNPNQVFDGKTVIQHNMDFLAQFLVPVVPEPATLVLLVWGGIMGIALRRRW